jgi:hypothetical protein
VIVIISDMPPARKRKVGEASAAAVRIQTRGLGKGKSRPAAKRPRIHAPVLQAVRVGDAPPSNAPSSAGHVVTAGGSAGTSAGGSNVNMCTHSLGSNIITVPVPEVASSTSKTSEMEAVSQSGVVVPNMIIESAETEVLVSVVDGLGTHLTQAIRDKICNGEFIELGSLFPDHDKPSSNPLTLSGVNEAGQLVFRDKPHKKIYSVEKWTSAFLIYSTVYLAKHPDKAQGVLKYMDIIRNSANQFGGEAWRTYDLQFRQKMARNPAKSWDTIDGELWLTNMVPQSPSKISESGANYSPKVGQAKIGICRSFNAGSCSWKNCKFNHKCSTCGSGHPAAKCFKNKGAVKGVNPSDKFRFGKHASRF